MIDCQSYAPMAIALISEVISLLLFLDSEEIYRCQTCIKTFTDFDELCQHQNELGKLPKFSRLTGNVKRICHHLLHIP